MYQITSTGFVARKMVRLHQQDSGVAVVVALEEEVDRTYKFLSFGLAYSCGKRAWCDRKAIIIRSISSRVLALLLCFSHQQTVLPVRLEDEPLYTCVFLTFGDSLLSSSF
ncbi:hypothetical protein Tco_0291838 [Tanacetum coccineum]